MDARAKYIVLDRASPHESCAQLACPRLLFLLVLLRSRKRTQLQAHLATRGSPLTLGQSGGRHSGRALLRSPRRRPVGRLVGGALSARDEPGVMLVPLRPLSSGCSAVFGRGGAAAGRRRLRL